MDAQQEAQRDKALAQKINLSHEAFLKLDPETVSQATLLLEQYINPDRLERVGSVLRQRTKRSKFLFENPSNPSNVWACLRTIDSFGIQNVDVAMNSGMYSGKQALNQKRGMRTAMGSAQWLTLSVHGSCQEAVHHIRNVQGYKIYASDLNPKSKDVRDVDWDAGPICVVMGNEDRGISEEMRELADETFVLPMCGFAESFNLSVATSITLAHMSSKSGNGKGPLRPGDLDEHEYNCLYLKGLMNSLPQKKMGRALLQKHGIELPDAIKDL
jgi:rRNA methylases